MSLMVPDWQPPAFGMESLPLTPLLTLSDDERALITRLLAKSWRERAAMELANAYYNGTQVITNLRIAVPPELEFLRTIVGWPAIAVDPLVERLAVDGFRLPGATVGDPDLEAVWLDSGMAADQALAFTDALVMGRGWITVGSPATPGDPPEVCVESPLNMCAEWNVRGSQPTALLQTYVEGDRRKAALYLPDQTIHVGEDEQHVWQLIDRDVHDFGQVSAVRLANKQRSTTRDGASEITAAVMALTDAACRTLLGLEIAREFYSLPQKVILGATEEDFQTASGQRRSAWETYTTRVLALEGDEDGNVPSLHQFTPYNPEVFTKLIEMYASQIGGIIAASPQELGLYTEGNPVSADSQDAVDARRVRRARHKQRMLGAPLVQVMQLAGRYMNGGTAPESFRRMSVDWADPGDFNLAAATDAIVKQVQVGAISPRSDVVLKRLGWNEVERAQLDVDYRNDAGQQVLAQLAESLQAKEARADSTVAADIAPTPRGDQG